LFFSLVGGWTGAGAFCLTEGLRPHRWLGD
jgi:hypothetical protein